jgi:acetylglutamate kinase
MPLGTPSPSAADVEKVDLLRQALPYIQRFKGRIFVVKLGGRVSEERENLHSVSEEIALCHNVGIRMVVIHGGGAQATRLSERLGIEPKFVNGRRITDDEVLDVAKMVYAGKINIEILSALRKHCVHGVGLSGVDGNILHARRREKKFIFNEATGQEELVDFGNVGDIESVDVELLHLLLNNGYVPVIACLGADPQGNIYNINADTVASEIAISFKAEKYINMSDVDGIYFDKSRPESLISRLTTAEAREYLREKRFTAGMIPKITTCLKVVENHVGSAHVINGTRRNSLLFEVFTDSGTGTMIIP